MRVLVTGAAGGVGRHVIEALTPDFEVVGFDMREGEERRGVRWVQGDILDLEGLVSACEGCDLVIHLAGIPIYSPDANVAIARTNVLGTQVVLEATVRAGVPRYVQASSICAAGFIFWSQRRTPAYFPIDEEYRDLPDDVYGLSKLVNEQFADAYARRYGIETTSFRMATVWVPGNPTSDHELSVLLTPAMDTDLEFVDLRWQYVDVRDVAQAYRAAAEQERGLGVCNIGAGDSPGGDWRVWVDDIYPDVPELRLPQRYVSDPTLPLWSIQKLQKECGYQPHHSWREYPTFVAGYERYLHRRRVGGVSTWVSLTGEASDV